MSTSGQMGTFGIQPGQMIDEYKIIGKIGRGGMATVYKAYQASMDRYVAIKILSFQLIDNEEFLGRFKQEARLIARLEHTNILPVYAYGEDHGIPYLVMRFLNAGTLKEYLGSKIPQQANKHQAVDNVPIANNAGLVSNPAPLTLNEINAIFSQLTDALSYAHENGVIHRDIKPSNVLLDQRGTVFLTDFGIAKLLESAIGRKETIPQFTSTGAITGTPDYMSPEQAQGLRLDQRSDIYSLGIVLFEMLTGKVPFDAETPIAVIMKQISEPLPRPSLFNPAIHPALESVVVKALEKSPAARHASMDAFLLAWKNALLQSTANAAAVPFAGATSFENSSTPAANHPPEQIGDGVGYNGIGYNGQWGSVQPGSVQPGSVQPGSVQRNSPPYFSPEKPTPSPATPKPVTPAGGALHATEDDSFPGKDTPPKINIAAGSPSSPSSPSNNAYSSPSKVGQMEAGGAAYSGAAYSGAAYSDYTGSLELRSGQAPDEDDKFLLKNFQMSKTASSREGMGGWVHPGGWVSFGYAQDRHPDGGEHRFGSKAGRPSQAPQAHRSSKRILWIAGGVALAILVIIGLAAAMNVFDFIREARQIPVGWIP